jgi:hypothetical protein
MKWLAIAALAVAAAAGFTAWQKNSALTEANQQLARLNADVQKAQADAKAAKAAADTLRKETAEARVAADQARADAASTRTFLDAERAMNAKLREDLTKATERLAASSRPARQQIPPQLLVPMPVQRQPLEVRIAPNRGQTQFGAPMQAAPVPAR